MSDRKELIPKMPCGFAADTGEMLTFKEVKSLIVSAHAEAKQFSNPSLAPSTIDLDQDATIINLAQDANITPIKKLTPDQKQILAISCWNHGLWDDFFIGIEHITKDKAIAAVENGSELGKELVDLMMNGYARIYKSLLPHDTKKYPLMETLRPAFWISPEVARRKLVTVYNNLSFTVYVHAYFVFRFGCIGDISPGQERIFYIRVSDHDEALLVAKDGWDSLSNVVSSYVVHPWSTTWNIATLPTDSFLPSLWKLDKTPWKVHITNNLKTYICIWQVLPNGTLHFMHVMPIRSFITADHCYIGTSLVATQGGTVISKFFADCEKCTKWSIDIGTPPGGGEIYKTGDNNYIFYQVHIPQDDTAKPTPINFRKQIQIPSGVKFLYASLFDSSNAYFAAPQNVTVIIDSQDGKTSYKHKTDIESLYIQMTKDGQSLQKLCVRNPEAGTWTITIKAMTNTPVYFQFQTVPTKDTYATMQATLSPHSVLGKNWKDIAYAGFTNIANTQTFGGKKNPDVVQIPAAVGATGEALVATQSWTSINSDIQNGEGDIEKATKTMSNGAAPSPSDLPGILLVDANGAHTITITMYQSRKDYLYQIQQNCSKLVGEHEATRQKFRTNVTEPTIKLISVAGHGNANSICGYVPLPVIRYPPADLLSTNDVQGNLANGKIFHLLACCTANTLGQTLVNNGAIACISYSERIILSCDRIWMGKPDCTILQELIINRKTIAQAKVRAEQVCTDLENKHRENFLDLCIYMRRNFDALTIIGNNDARLCSTSQ